MFISFGFCFIDFCCLGSLLFLFKISACRAANELNLDYKVIHRKFMHFRKCISNYCNYEAIKLYGELELDESYFGGKRKGNRGRGAKNKAKKGSVFYTDSWRSYASLEQYGKHNIIDYDKELVNNHNHINGISFQSQKRKCL